MPHDIISAMSLSLKLFSLIATYGYAAIFVGSFFEGEVIILLAGLLVHEGQLSLPLILIFAFLGAIAADNTWFMLGRRGGLRISKRWSWFEKLAGKPISLVGKNPISTTFFMRFMYGFRIIVPFSLGMSNLPTRTFIIWNALGAGAWIGVFVGLGYLLAGTLTVVVGRLRHFELLLVMLVILALVLLNLLARWLKKLLKKFVNKEIMK